MLTEKENYEKEKEVVYDNMECYAKEHGKRAEFFEFFEFYDSMPKDEIVLTWLWFKLYYNI